MGADGAGQGRKDGLTPENEPGPATPSTTHGRISALEHMPKSKYSLTTESPNHIIHISRCRHIAEGVEMAWNRVEIPEGARYGNLVVIGESATRRSAGGSVKRYMLCQCDCGNQLEVRFNNLRSGHTQSCGCYVPPKQSTAPGYHGMKDSDEYGIWVGMKRRCYKEYEMGFSNYGGRGITVCDRWRHSFKAFFEDMGPRPSKDHSIDRIDGNGNYEPGNCRWSTRKEQNRNRRDNRNYTFQGKTMCLADWAAEFKMRKGTLFDRLARGMTLEEALTTPVRKWVPQEGNGRCVMRERHEQACEHCGYETGGTCVYLKESP